MEAWLVGMLVECCRLLIPFSCAWTILSFSTSLYILCDMSRVSSGSETVFRPDASCFVIDL